MSRYTGPRLRIMRALGVQLPGLSRKSFDARPHPPGQHGQARDRRKSEFSAMLAEKQKLRFNYGLGERQMRRLVAEARRTTGRTGDALLEFLERRLDNAVFRAGYAPTAMAARQLVSHRHVLLNGRTVNIASIRVKPGDEIALKDKALSFPHVAESLERPALDVPEWIAFDAGTRRARITRTPLPDEVPFPVDVYRVVEFYSVRS